MTKDGVLKNTSINRESLRTSPIQNHPKLSIIEKWRDKA